MTEPVGSNLPSMTPGVDPFKLHRRELKKPWHEAELVEIDADTVSNVQKTLYGYAKDFGNMGKQERFDTLHDMLSKTDPAIDKVDEEIRNSFIKSLLSHMGELETYSVGEGLYDIGVPAVGAAAGSLAGGPAGAIGGSALSAGIGEALKANYERAQRGIEPMTVEEMVKTGLPIAIAEAIFSAGVPLLSRMRLGVARKMLLPGGPLKGSIKNLPEQLLKSQEIIGRVPVERHGIYSALTDRLRYGKQGPRASLSVGQLNEASENFVSTLAQLTGDSWFGKGVTKKVHAEAFEAATEDTLHLMNQIGHERGWDEVGRIVSDAVSGNMKMAAGMRDAYWADARRTLKDKNIGVSLGVIDKFIREEGKRRFRKDEMDALAGAIHGFLEQPRLPLAIDSTDALDLWHFLNRQSKNREFGPAAGHLAGQLRDELFNRVKQVTKSGPEYDALVRARHYHIAYKETFNNDLIKSMLRSMGKTPSIVESYIARGGGTRLDKLMTLKDALPARAYDQQILPVLRYSFIEDAAKMVPEYGKVLDANKIISKMEKYGLTYNNDGSIKSGGKYLTEVFSGEENVKNVYDNMRAILAAQSGSGGSKILMKMVEAGAVMGAVYQPTPEVVGKTILIATTPFALASGVFTNRRLARELTDGVMGHKPIEHAIMTATRLMEQGHRGWTQEQINTLSDYFNEKAQKFSAQAQ